MLESRRRQYLELHRHRGRALDDGLWMVRQDNSADVAGDTRITFGQPLKVLSASMRKDQVVSRNGVPVSAVVHTEDFSTISGSGTDTGSARAFGVARVDLPDGTHIPAAVKVGIEQILP
jgi:hypothetical protein